MNFSLDRAKLLQGDLTGRTHPLRPPWAIAEPAFIEQCTRCSACITACPTQILVKGRGGFPKAELGECTFCEKCVQACPSNALSKNTSPPWSIKAKVTQTCLTQQGIMCSSCKEHCDAQAIRLVHQLGRVAVPIIDETICTGCGACIAPCPSQAIQIYQP